MGVLDRGIDRIAAWVASHNRIVLAAILVLSAGVLYGIPMIELEGDGAFGDDLEPESDIAEAAAHIEQNYESNDSDEEDGPPTSTSLVYVRAEDGNVLTRETLLEAVEYQIEVTDDEAVSEQLAEEGTVGPQNLVAIRLAGDPGADLQAQRDALEAASDEEVEAAIDEVLDGGDGTQTFLPASYAPGTTEAESFRMQFTFELAEEGTDAPDTSDSQRVLFDAAEERNDPNFYTLGEFASQEWSDQQTQDTIWLILPLALLLVVGVLAVAYRNPVDVVIGFAGVFLSVLWMFGIIGWLGIPAGMTIIIGPVLIVALSIDFGLHVFMRYREQRGPGDGIRESMALSTGSVATAFLLVTGTAAIGFLSNLTSPLSFIQDLGVGITLGVISSFVIFVTFVPALKISADGLIERIGFDTRQAPLGHGRYLRPVLEGGVRIAQRGAPVVIVLALIVGAAGALAYAEVDREGVQTEFEVADWKTELPGPMAWEASEMEYQQNLDHQQQQYQSTNDFASVTRFLIEGDPTDPATLAAIDNGQTAAQDNPVTFAQGDRVQVQSILTVMQAVAAQDRSFAEEYEAADTNGDGVPDENVRSLYDSLYEIAPEQAAQVLERSDDGEYRTTLVYVPVQQPDNFGEQGDAMHDLADEMESDETTATPVGVATISNAELAVLADGILRTMLLALAGVLVTLTAVYRFERGSATLGALTVIPIAMVLGLVFCAMYVFDIPLTFVTALLMSITIGLGIDYNIHISDRFAQEIEGGATTVEALTDATTGTGGALLGSALTSGAAFLTLVLHPSPQLQSFGAIVVFALLSSFVLSVYVLPSLLYVWAEHTDGVESVDATSSLPSDD